MIVMYILSFTGKRRLVTWFMSYVIIRRRYGFGRQTLLVRVEKRFDVLLSHELPA